MENFLKKIYNDEYLQDDIKYINEKGSYDYSLLLNFMQVWFADVYKNYRSDTIRRKAKFIVLLIERIQCYDYDQNTFDGLFAGKGYWFMSPINSLPSEIAKKCYMIAEKRRKADIQYLFHYIGRSLQTIWD